MALGLIGGIKPIGGKGNHQEFGPGFGKGPDGRSLPVLESQVKIVGGLGDIEEGVGIEPFDEFGSLIAKVAFHLEIGVKIIGKIIFILEPAAELQAHGFIGKVGDVADHPGHGQAQSGFGP